MSVVVKEYDFHTAITKALGVVDPAVVIINKCTELSDSCMIVDTNVGSFMCESYGDAEQNVYMKVTSVHI